MLVSEKICVGWVKLCAAPGTGSEVVFRSNEPVAAGGALPRWMWIAMQGGACRKGSASGGKVPLGFGTGEVFRGLWVAPLPVVGIHGGVLWLASSG